MKAKLIWTIPIAALGAALLDMPYGYYPLLRLLVCAVCTYLAMRENELGNIAWVWILGAVAVLYNPIFKFHLGRDFWALVNVGTVGLLAIHMWCSQREGRRLTGEGSEV